MTTRPRIEIEYCTQCRWLLRAAWTAQELLTTFEAEVGGVMLVPGSGGIFEVRIDGTTVWSRKERERFPELKELKQLVRDHVAPPKKLYRSGTVSRVMSHDRIAYAAAKPLGHSERERPETDRS